MSFVRVQCKGEMVGCERCKNLYKNSGFCLACGRPLWKKIGEKCDVACAYVERGYVWTGKVKVKCRFCKYTNVI